MRPSHLLGWVGWPPSPDICQQTPLPCPPLPPALKLDPAEKLLAKKLGGSPTLVAGKCQAAASQGAVRAVGKAVCLGHEVGSGWRAGWQSGGLILSGCSH